MFKIVDSIPEKRASVIDDVKEFLNTGEKFAEIDTKNYESPKHAYASYSAVASKHKFPISFTLREGRLFMIRE